MEELLEQIKKSMRIGHTALDDTLLSDIEAGALELKRAGVQALEEDGKTLRDEALVYKALELYCKAQEDFEGKGPMYEAAYEKLRDSMALCGDYR